MQYTYGYSGETYTITLERKADGGFLATIGEAEYSITASEIATGRWLLRVNGERFLAHTASDNEARYVHLNGTQFKLERVEKRRKRKGTSGAGDLTAEMPGQVIDVRVTEGTAVQSGDVLVVLEAMKMEIRITAPHSGTVTKLLVQTGDIVDRGQRLIEIEEVKD